MADLNDLFASDAVELRHVPTDDELKSVRALGAKLVKLNQEKESLEKRLETLQETINTVQQQDLPKLMDSLQLDNLGLPEDQCDLRVENYYHANIAKNSEHREEAFKWLVDHGHEALLKVSVTCTFARGEYEKAARLVERLKKAGYEPEMEQGVPWNTLTAWLKDLASKKDAVLPPLKIFGATIGRIVKIKPRKN